MDIRIRRLVSNVPTIRAMIRSQPNQPRTSYDVRMYCTYVFVQSPTRVLISYAFVCVCMILSMCREKRHDVTHVVLKNSIRTIAEASVRRAISKSTDGLITSRSVFSASVVLCHINLPTRFVVAKHYI